MLAAVLLGAGPAALIGVLSIAVGWFRSREAAHTLRNNLATFAWYPLIAGLFFHAMTGLAGVGPRAIGYYLLVFAASRGARHELPRRRRLRVLHRRESSADSKARDAVVPLLSAQLFSALLTMGAVYLAVQLGTVGLAVLGLMFVIFQYLVGELLKSSSRSEDLQRMATTDELTGLANRERFRRSWRSGSPPPGGPTALSR